MVTKPEVICGVVAIVAAVYDYPYAAIGFSVALVVIAAFDTIFRIKGG